MFWQTANDRVTGAFIIMGKRAERAPALHSPTAATHPKTFPAEFVATRLAAALQAHNQSLCYVALSERQVDEIAVAMTAIFPEIKHVILPPWDCLPYDRVPPSRHCMGRRMDALRIWQTSSGERRLLLTSLDAMLQRIPPEAIIAVSKLELAVGQTFDRDAFFEFVQRTGYVEEPVADDPGEVAVREGVIDIYPGGAPGPLRIILSEKGSVGELRGFDRLSQRTESQLDRVTIGPASEAIAVEATVEDAGPAACTMERLLLRLYPNMPTVFDFLGSTPLNLAPGADERLTRLLEIIEDARQMRVGKEEPAGSSLYLSRNDWEQLIDACRTAALDLQGGRELPENSSDRVRRGMLVEFVADQLKSGLKVVAVGTGKGFEAFCGRAATASGVTPLTIDTWGAVAQAKPGALLKLSCELERGFVDETAGIVLVAAADASGKSHTPGALLAEPELRIGDVAVHEDHGVGVLEDLESIVVDGITRDTARLVYRDGNSVLVPMEEFGKIWRYGSEPEAVTLDRLHTDAWQKKRIKIGSDIQSTARHLLKIAKQRQSSYAEKFVPPRAEFSAFARRFPFSETADQAQAIKAVLADLASGQPMNRLVCGDVGFGKTEIALRAAAAVALAGGQVVVIAPTTVLARQHYATFTRRFAGTGVKIGMLSRLLKPSEAKRVKAALAAGEIGVIVATQAILAKDVHFPRLSMVIVDEEHRFGLKEKRAMADLAPALHTLTMSATPIPRSLQSAMVGVQEVSLLTTPPLRRRPIRTSLAAFDKTSMRTGLMRESKRGGQSFVVVPRIEDIESVEALLQKIVPELSVKVAHGKMPAAKIDETIVEFADGNGDILLATNIIENGLDIPRANSIFILHAERFGLAQLHQMRGRVGRASAQGLAYILTEEGTEPAEETRLRLSTLVENDRLGAGLAISLRDLDLRGGGDLAGEDQAGHLKVLGTGLYQKLLADAVAKLRKQPSGLLQRPVLHLEMSGTIPADYVSDSTVRLNLYARLLRTSKVSEVDDLAEEFEDRFGEPPQDALRLLRTTKLQIAAGRLSITKLEAGPKALALTVTRKTPAKVINAIVEKAGVVRREDRLIISNSCDSGDEQLDFFEHIISTARRH